MHHKNIFNPIILFSLAVKANDNDASLSFFDRLENRLLNMNILVFA